MQCDGELEIRVRYEVLDVECVDLEMSKGEIVKETQVAKEAISAQNKFLRRKRSRSRLQRIL